eukprot:GHVO01054364.1.p1 GENE.GHVO01054364.1~~GHVO01054364.1.p1  ORF type:complete len:266 (+),score=64.52 GHVO01054364.1:21-818(+)
MELLESDRQLSEKLSAAKKATAKKADELTAATEAADRAESEAVEMKAKCAVAKSAYEAAQKKAKSIKIRAAAKEKERINKAKQRMQFEDRLSGALTVETRHVEKTNELNAQIREIQEDIDRRLAEEAKSEAELVELKRQLEMKYQNEARKCQQEERASVARRSTKSRAAMSTSNGRRKSTPVVSNKLIMRDIDDDSPAISVRSMTSRCSKKSAKRVATPSFKSVDYTAVYGASEEDPVRRRVPQSGRRRILCNTVSQSSFSNFLE